MYGKPYVKAAFWLPGYSPTCNRDVRDDPYNCGSCGFVVSQSEVISIHAMDADQYV